MKKFMLIVLLILFPVAVASQSSSQTASLVLKDTRGRAFSLSAYKGKVVLVNFWATWCPPCRKEVPDLIKMQKQYRDQGLRIIGITYPPEKMSDVIRFMRKLGVNYRVAIGTKADKALFTASETLPMTVVINRDGAVRDVVEGILYSDEFDQKVKPLLSAQSARSSRKPRSLKPVAIHQQRGAIVLGTQGYALKVYPF
jgi:cytochrome c biogenesis protein CcmG/thiol:disulfide interchange protein DsbE